jgi:hypothetical protein
MWVNVVELIAGLPYPEATHEVAYQSNNVEYWIVCRSLDNFNWEVLENNGHTAIFGGCRVDYEECLFRDLRPWSFWTNYFNIFNVIHIYNIHKDAELSIVSESMDRLLYLIVDLIVDLIPPKPPIRKIPLITGFIEEDNDDGTVSILLQINPQICECFRSTLTQPVKPSSLLQARLE